MNDRIGAGLVLPAALTEHLSLEDDPALWVGILRGIAEDAREFAILRSKLYVEIGACSHWLRPHKIRWRPPGGSPAGYGLAYPAGYGFAYPAEQGSGKGFGGAMGLPRFDWSVMLLFIPASGTFETPSAPPTKRFRSARVAVPSRTTRHRQAVVHTLWPSGTLDARHTRTVLYGFRNVNGVWGLKARSKMSGEVDRAAR
jgi:hypothetical protein